MQGIRTRAAHFRTRWFPTDSLSRQGIPSLKDVKPLYDRPPPWYSRWTYTLVCADLIVTAYACELTWSHWTHPVQDPTQDDGKTGSGKQRQQPAVVSGPNPNPGSTAGTIATSPPPATTTVSNANVGANTANKDLNVPHPAFELRPAWQRTSFVLGQMFLGVALAVLILGGASRQVHRMWIIPTPSSLLRNPRYKLQIPTTPNQNPSNPLSKQTLIVSTVHHFSGRGKIIPLTACKLRKGQDKDEVIVAPEGYTGSFWLELGKGTKVNGEEMPAWNMKQVIYKAFYGQGWAKPFNKHGWVDR